MTGFIVGEGRIARLISAQSPDLVPATMAEAQDQRPALLVIAVDQAELVDGSTLLSLLVGGARVVTTGYVDVPLDELQAACRRGASAYHQVGLFEFFIGRTLATMVQGFASVDQLRVVESLDLTATAESDALSDPITLLDRMERRRRVAVMSFVEELFHAPAEGVRIECSRSGTDFPVSLHLEAYLGDRRALVTQTSCSIGPGPLARGDWHAFPGLTGPVSFAVEVQGDPANSHWQAEFTSEGEEDPVSVALASLVLDAVPAVSGAAPGVLAEDAAPRYQLDDRVGG